MSITLSSMICLAFTTSLAAANPHLVGHKWHMPRQAGNVRSPCPGLNVLANEGFLNFNGRNIKLSDLSNTLQNVYNFDVSLAASLAYTANPLTANSTTGALSQQLNLDWLDKHGGLEHDASLTRDDYSEGDQVTLQPGLLEAMLADSPTEYITVESLAKTRVRRENYSEALGNSARDVKTTTLAYIETAVILLVLGRTKDAKGNPQALKTDVQRWFQEERLPVGWTTPGPIGFPEQLAMSTKIQLAAAAIRASSK